MKSLLVSLLLANGIVAGYALFAPNTRIDDAPPPLDAPRLRLVAERTEVVEIREPSSVHESAQPAVASAGLKPATASQCRTWGPFARRADAEALHRRLAASGAVPDLRTEPVDPRRLVTVDPVQAGLAASSLCAALRERGVECQIIASGARRGAVSVGIFRQPALAKRQAARVVALGYPAEVVPWRERDTAFTVVAWVDAPLSESGTASAACAAIAPMERFL
jgi:hypothetical protein